MTNLNDTETKVTVGDRKTLTEKKYGNWNSLQKRNGKQHHVTSINTAVIIGLHANTKMFPTDVRGQEINP